MPRTGLPPNMTSQLLYSLVGAVHGAAEIQFRLTGTGASWRDTHSAFRNHMSRSWHEDQPRATRLRARGELEKSLTVAQDLAASAAAGGIALFGQLMSAYTAAPTLAYLGRFDEMEALPWTCLPLFPTGIAIVAHFLAAVGQGR